MAPTLSPNVVAILGVFRGGTSSVATALSRMGFYFGAPEDFNEADDQNPGGNWELKELQVLNARALQAFGMDYFRAEALPENWPSMPWSGQIVDDMRALLLRRFRDRPLWAWKEPSTTLLMPLYKVALKEEAVSPIYAICVRHPKSVARSIRARQMAWGYEKRDDPSASTYPLEARTIGLWVLYTLLALRESAGSRRVLFYYDHFLEAPRPYLERIGEQVREDRPDDGRLEEAASALKPQWRHSKYGEADLDGYPDIVRATYDLVLKADADAVGLVEGRFDHEVESLWRQWTSLSGLARPIALPAGHMMLMWKAGSEVRHQAAYFSPHGDWQALAVDLEVPPNSTIQLDPYQTPCQVWIRSAQWEVDGQRRPVLMKAGPNGLLQAFGDQLLTVFGPGSLMIQAPKEGKATLHLEILVMDDAITLTRIIAMMRERLESSHQEFSKAFRMRR